MKVHGACGVALRGDDLALADFEPAAERRQLVGKLNASQGLGEPIAQARRIAAAGRSRADHRLLASFERPVDIRGHRHAAGDESTGVKGFAKLGG
jgi:hypothetical protein